MHPDHTYPRTLLIVDDVDRRRELESTFIERRFVVSAPRDFDAAMSLLTSFEPDVVVTRTTNGLGSVLRRIRSQSDCLALMIQIAPDEIERINLFRDGADDVAPGTASDLEIVVRCEALLRRRVEVAPVEDVDLIEVGPLTIDHGRHEVRMGDKVVPATRIEFALLANLAKTPTQVVTREELLGQVWGPHWVGDAHVVDVHLSNIRRKLKEVMPNVSVIRTVRGVGFRMSDDVAQCPQSRPDTAVHR